MIMAKSKTKFHCKSCDFEISASVFMNHLKTKHFAEYQKINVSIELVLNEFETTKCNCGQFLIRKPNSKNCVFFAIMKNEDTKTYLHKVCSKKCKKHLKSWNSGLSKDNNETLAQMSKDRMGDLNPIHNITNKSRKLWKEKLSKSLKNNPLLTRNLEEKVGIDNAVKCKEKMSNSARKRLIHGHTGMKHLEETKKILSEKCVEFWSTRKTHVSKCQQKLFEALSELNPILEYVEKYFSIDIAILSHKIAIEVDGDFWHVNQQAGFECVYESQKRNLANDARKNTFLKNKGWTVVRFWESQVNENLTTVVSSIKDIINEKTNV